MARQDSEARYTLVIVSHDVDQPFLDMQAKSLRLYLDRDPAFVDRIIVIDNSNMRAIRREALAAHLGPLADRLAFLSLADAGVTAPARGWIRQQALKILAARWVRTRRYVVLDAKNHLVRGWSRNDVETPDTYWMRSQVHGYRNHPLRPYVVNAITYFGQDMSLLDRFLPSQTPYVFSTEVARELIGHIEHREGETFGRWFCADRRDVTEFALYAAFLRFTGREFETLYHLANPSNPVLWRQTTPAQFDKRLREAETRPVFGVHRGAFRGLDPSMRRRLSAFWRDRGLFATEAEALGFVEACALYYR